MKGDKGDAGPPGMPGGSLDGGGVQYVPMPGPPGPPGPKGDPGEGRGKPWKICFYFSIKIGSKLGKQEIRFTPQIGSGRECFDTILFVAKLLHLHGATPCTNRRWLLPQTSFVLMQLNMNSIVVNIV